jgi:hypothetical protein
MQLKESAPHNYNMDTRNLHGQIAKHAFAKEILRTPGWDVAFPDSHISVVDAFAYSKDATLRFQVKYAGVCKCPTSGGSKVIIPLRNSYRKDYSGRMGHKVLYFENNIDCIYCFIPELDKGIFIAPEMTKPGQTMFHVRISLPPRVTKRTRMWYYHTDFQPEVLNGNSDSNGSLSVS